MHYNIFLVITLLCASASQVSSFSGPITCCTKGKRRCTKNAEFLLSCLAKKEDELVDVERIDCKPYGLQPLHECIKETKMSHDACRVFHGRGGLHPGCENITLDWFPPVWLLTSYNQECSPEELATVQKTLENRWHELIDTPGNSVADVHFNFAYQFRASTNTNANANATTQILSGTIPDQHVISENGMKFKVQLSRGKNHGIFLDMVNGRDWIRQRSSGKKVLNLFSYTCGFSVAALMGGAELVVNMDMVDAVLKTGQRNHDLNDLSRGGARFFAHDIFKSWGKIKRLGPYDIIVADPPSFQKKSFIAKKDYGKIIRRLPGLLSESGEVLLCLNAPELDSKWLQDLVASEAPELNFLGRLENPSSFASTNPERGLKVLVFRL